MKITVASRYYFEKLRGTAEEAELFQRSRVISVNSVRIPEEPPFSQQYWTADNVLILHFDDVDGQDFVLLKGSRFMTEEDADAIACFVESPDQSPIIVHCTAGISRSGAIGASLNEYYNKKCALHESDHDAFWSRHPNISPNLHVMKLLWKRLQIEI